MLSVRITNPKVIWSERLVVSMIFSTSRTGAHTATDQMAPLICTGAYATSFSISPLCPRCQPET